MTLGMTRRQAAVNAIRKRGGGLLVEVVVNVALPYAVYSLLQPRYGDVRALLASSAPPIGWSLAEFARKRQVDAVSLLVLLGIALSLLAFIGGGSVKFLQLRENLVTGAIGLVFLGSAAIGKPIIYHLAIATAARQSTSAGVVPQSASAGMVSQSASAGMVSQSTSAAGALVTLKDNVALRRMMTLMTLVWGFGLLAATAVACALVFTLSIQNYLLVSPFVGYGIMGVLALWTMWFSRRARMQGRPRASFLEHRESRVRH